MPPFDVVPTFRSMQIRSPTQSSFSGPSRLRARRHPKAGKEHPRVAFCGERAGRLWPEGKADEAIRLEQFCGELVRSHDVDVLCAYPLPHNREDD